MDTKLGNSFISIILLFNVIKYYPYEAEYIAEVNMVLNHNKVEDISRVPPPSSSGSRKKKENNKYENLSFSNDSLKSFFQERKRAVSKLNIVQM